YYPTHLQDGGAGTASFDEIRQLVQVVEDREDFEERRAQELERMRRAGLPVERLAYAPWRSRPEEEGQTEREEALLSPPVPWDGRAGQRYRQAVILGDPGFGKTWLLRYEARRLAREEAEKLRAEVISLD